MQHDTAFPERRQPEARCADVPRRRRSPGNHATDGRRARMTALARELTNERIVADANAWADFLQRCPRRAWTTPADPLTPGCCPPRGRWHSTRLESAVLLG